MFEQSKVGFGELFGYKSEKADLRTKAVINKQKDSCYPCIIEFWGEDVEMKTMATEELSKCDLVYGCPTLSNSAANA